MNRTPLMCNEPMPYDPEKLCDRDKAHEGPHHCSLDEFADEGERTWETQWGKHTASVSFHFQGLSIKCEDIKNDVKLDEFERACWKVVKALREQ